MINKKPEIITLSGSTRFKKQFQEIEKMLTLKGKIVLPPAIYGKAEDIIYDNKTEEILFNLQLSKIDLSDSIFVIDVDNYLGSSTKKEVQYAKGKGKKIYYYSKLK